MKIVYSIKYVFGLGELIKMDSFKVDFILGNI